MRDGGPDHNLNCVPLDSQNDKTKHMIETSIWECICPLLSASASASDSIFGLEKDPWPAPWIFLPFHVSNFTSVSIFVNPSIFTTGMLSWQCYCGRTHAHRHEVLKNPNISEIGKWKSPNSTPFICQKSLLRRG